MQQLISRRSFLSNAAAFAALAAAGGLSACGSSGTAGSSGAQSALVRIGTMPTEDILPMWVAERDGLFEQAGVEAEVTVFDSAPNLSAAITAGEVDLAMTDPMRAIKLCESGTDVVMEWVTLGTEPEQGRFGVLVGPDSPVKKLTDLATCENGVGVAANTVPEYVLDELCEGAGLAIADINKEEVASLPERFSLVAEGRLDAAALPGSLLALGEASGMKVLADDTDGANGIDNLSQSVMVVRSEFAKGSQALVDGVRKAWDLAAEQINAHPGDFRELLVEKANLNERIADSYPVPQYPVASTDEGGPARPPAKLIEPQIAWMQQQGYTDHQVGYDEATGMFDIG